MGGKDCNYLRNPNHRHILHILRATLRLELEAYLVVPKNEWLGLSAFLLLLSPASQCHSFKNSSQPSAPPGSSHHFQIP